MLEAALGLVGGALRLARPHERIGRVEHRDHREDLVRAIQLRREEQHLGELWIERELGHHGAQLGEVAVVVKRTKVVEQLERAHQGLWRRRVHEVKVDEVLNAELLQLQHHGAQVRAQDLGVRLFHQLLLVRLLRVQPEALARLGAACPARALVSRGLGDGGDQERLDPDARVVNLLLGEARIDHIHDPVNRERRLRNVGRKDDLAAVGIARLARRRRRVEDLPLPIHRQSRVQRKHQHVRHLLAQIVNLLLRLAARVLDLLLAREEDEDVALAFAQVHLHDGADGSLEVVALWLGCVEDLDRVQPARDLHERRRVEVRLELTGIERRAHHNQLEIRSLRGHLLDQPKEDVGRQRALVRFVEDHSGVSLEQWVRHRLAQEHAVRHVLENRLGARHVFEADGVPHLLSQLDVHLLRYTLRDGHGSHTTRLRACDKLAPACEACVHTERWDLRRFARARLSDKHDRLILLDHLEELLFLLPHRQPLALFENLKVPLRVWAAIVWVD
mmetsp:Transcript_14985/g.34329  ORF Transcript_14985/g.34329 Transcript_14985/m.34329 type:complete len:504 (+) Transcript_14985:753-2264(+)